MEVTALNFLNAIFNSLKYYNHYFYFLLYFMHIGVFPTCMSGYHLWDQYDGAQKRALDLLELDSPKVIRHHAGTEN